MAMILHATSVLSQVGHLYSTLVGIESLGPSLPPCQCYPLSTTVVTSYPCPTVELLEFKLQQDRAMIDDLRSSLDDEKGHVREMSSQLSEDRTSRSRFQTEIGDMQSRITLLQDALVREQARLASTS